MFETLLTAGSAKGYYPNSGPGTKKLLSGDEDFGYFGVVTEAEMKGISTTLVDLLAAANPSRAHIRYESDNWIKVFYRRKVLYYPISPLAYGFTTHEFVKARLFRNDGRAVELNTTSSATDTPFSVSGLQNRRIYVNEGSKDWKLAPRLPLTNRTAVIDSMVEARSEFNDVLGALFGYYKPAFMLEPGVVLCRLNSAVETVSNFLTGEVYRDYTVSTLEADKTKANRTHFDYTGNVSQSPSGNYALTSYGLSSTSSTKYAYRPILELDQDTATTTEAIYPISFTKATVDTALVGQETGSVAASVELMEIEDVAATSAPNTLASQGFVINNLAAPEFAVASSVTNAEQPVFTDIGVETTSVRATVSRFLETDLLTTDAPVTDVSENMAVIPFGVDLPGEAELSVQSAEQFTIYAPNWYVPTNVSTEAVLTAQLVVEPVPLLQPNWYSATNTATEAQLSVMKV